MTLPPDPFTKSKEVAILRDAIADVVALHGCLPNDEANKIARFFGCTVRTVYRHARATKDASADPGATTDSKTTADAEPRTFLESLARGEGFHADELFWDLYYLCAGNMARVRLEVESLGYSMPSLPTLSRIKRRLPPLFQDGARHGLANRNKKVLHVRHSAAVANEAWQVDELTFDIDVLAPSVRRRGGTDTNVTDTADEERQVIQPRLVIFEDDYSRFIPAWAVLPGAVDSAEFLATMAAGIEVRPAEDAGDGRIGGPPDTLVFDNAQAFRSFLVADCLTTVPIGARPAPAYTPTAKGKVERVIQTIQEWVITGLPGVRSKATRLDGTDMLGLDPGYFLEFDTFVEIVRRVIYEYNYERVHSAIGCAPIERYRGSGTTARTVTDANLAALWLPVHRDTGRRKVHTSGVKVTFGETFFYQASELATLIDHKVQVRAQLCRTDRVAVFAGDDRSGYHQFVCFAKKSTTLTATECNEIAGTGVAQSSAVSATHRRARRALEQRSEDLATGTERSIVEALVASTRQVVAAVSAEAEGDVDGAAAAPAGGARGEVRRPGRRPATRKAASVTKKSAALPASKSTRAKKGELVDLAKGAMAQQDAATSGTSVRRANVKPRATASAARRPAKQEASRNATASKKATRRSEARKSSKGSR